MNVILLQKIGKLGEIGDTASVKAGYARNYLFPFGIAIPATKSNLEDFEQRRSELMAAHNEKVAIATARAEKVIGVSVTIEVNASDEGKLFGSVGTKEISDALNEATGSDVAKSEVQLPDGAIRETGSSEVVLDFGFDVSGSVTVNVVSDGTPVQTLDDDEDGEDSEEAAEQEPEA